MPLEQGGTKETGWLAKWAFQVGALAADAIGRQAVEDGYLYEAKLRVATDNALNAGRVAKYTYDFAVQGGAIAALPLTGSALPAKALVYGGFMEMITALTSGGAASAALSVEGANDLVVATLVSGAPWSTQGRKAIIPVFTAATIVKTTVARTPALTPSGFVLTAGKFNLFLFYTVADA